MTNNVGQLGLWRVKEDVATPQRIETLRGLGARILACGLQHSAAACDNGDLYGLWRQIC